MDSSRAADSLGQIVLAATPIGNPLDASMHLRELLGSADLIAAEDTRRLHRLCKEIGVEPRGSVISYHEHNEAEKTSELLDAAKAGSTVVMVSDAGMPAVSDPGFRLAQAAAAAHVRLSTAPGASAVLTALALSGLPTDRFAFEGFPPRKAGERASRFAELSVEKRTLVFFEAPHRLAVMLTALAQAFGSERKAVVARELTKTYEEVLRGSLEELAHWAESEEVRGEIVVVVAGHTGPLRTIDSVVPEVLQRTVAGERLKDVSSELAGEHGLSKRELYQAAIDARSAETH